ncbi:adenine nucleotide alpha hydrolase family protein [Rhodococcus wratislaviensis]|uniref:hypothetical protein n=1 Tax=Rhodococcus wratislaviensis TaxID=44752 RepID=UPI0036594D25
MISSFGWPSRSVWDRLEFHDPATVPDTGGTKAASRGALSVAAGTGCHRASFAPAPVEHGIAHARRIVAELLPRRRVVCTIPRRLVRQTRVRDRPVRHLLELAGDAQLILVGNRGRAACRDDPRLDQCRPAAHKLHARC